MMWVSLGVNVLLTVYCTALWLSTRRAIWRIEAARLVRAQQDLATVRKTREMLEELEKH